MYIDYIKNDYSDKTESERQKYIERDKKHLASIIQENVANDIGNIVERWLQLDDIGCIQVNEKFLRLLKEAEELYYFGYYTGAIAIIGIAAEEFSKFLMNINNITDAKNQQERIDKLKRKHIIEKDMQSNLHRIRRIRNDCMHYNSQFKMLDMDNLAQKAFSMVKMYKDCLRTLSANMVSDNENVQYELYKTVKKSFNDFKYRQRNIQRTEENIDLQISPDISYKVVTSMYYVEEVDVDTEDFKEMTLLDMNNSNLSVIVDLTLPQVTMMKDKGIQAQNVIIASIIAKVTTLGQTEEWTLLSIQDVFHGCIPLKDIVSI